MLVIKDLLEKYGIRPVHDRGQNFLVEEKVLSGIADGAEIRPGDAVIEIGPGPGVLTAELLARGAEVVGVELDRRFYPLLRDRFVGQKFRLLEKDALSVSNRDLVAAFGRPPGQETYSLVANLPYGITSAVLEKFLLEEPKPLSLTLMLQREVADRLLAGRGDMSSLAVMVRVMGEPRRVMNVPRGAFRPSPKVDSAVIHIRVFDQSHLAAFFGDKLSPDAFIRIVRMGFSAKRKKLKNSLGQLGLEGSVLEKSLNEAKIPPDSRPEQLLPEDWRRLALALVDQRK